MRTKRVEYEYGSIGINKDLGGIPKWMSWLVLLV